GGRLVPGLQPQPARPLAYVGLGEAGVHEREGGAALGGGPLAGPVVVEVVEVDAQHDRRRPAVPAQLAGQRGDGPQQRVLAPVAAVAVVATVGGLLEPAGLALRPEDAR